MKTQKPYAIITARSGSKRIPQKNIREFCGKPIIAYSIEAALESRLFDEVMVSTDSVHIADIATKYCASVPFLRSQESSDDYSSTTDVLNEVIKTYGMNGVMFDEFCCIYPTAPFVTAKKLVESYQILQAPDVYNVVPMVQFSFPPQRGMKVTSQGYLKPVDTDGINSRSQDLSVLYHDCGQFYWIKTEEFLNNDDFLNNHTKPFFVPETEVQDIDNETDWQLAELKYRFMKGLI